MKKRSKKEVDRLLKQLDEMKSKEHEQAACSIPGHIVTYEKNEDGNYNAICYSCKVYPL